MLKVFGQDQCEGSFVEIGGGDGITDSLTLYFEKMMGWRGLIFEGDTHKFEALTHTGRQVKMSKGYVVGSVGAAGGGLDVRKEMHKHFDMTDETKTTSMIVINEVNPKLLTLNPILNQPLIP